MPPTPTPKRHPYDQWAPDARALDLVGDKWTLLIVRDLAAGPRRFVELQRVLPGISTEQLRSRLNRMVADGLLTRQRYREVPPRVDYELTTRSKELLPVLGALARWGYDWAWTAPRESEAIDIGAILRIAPGLISPPPPASGVADFAVEVDATTTKHYTLTVHRGSVAISEVEQAEADAMVSGSQEDWVDALGPEGDRGGLRIDGDKRLASMLLDAVGAHDERKIRVA
jgi:DNA-binding HxlR family transcriptional regulator